MLTERFSKILLWLGVFLFAIGLILFFWQESIFSISSKIDATKFGQLGDLFGGVIGSIWALAGVILFYVALTEQRKDIKTNQDALFHQIKVFELQQTELEETRKVFIEQSETLKIQRFENTFFQLLNLFHEIIDKLTYNPKIHGFEELYEKRGVLNHAAFELQRSIYKIGPKQLISEESSLEDVSNQIKSAYIDFYTRKFDQLLSNYFQMIYHILKFIKTSDLIQPEKKQFYASLVRAQLSQDELFLLFYNSMVDGFGYPKSLYLIKEFDILQNFNSNLTIIMPKHKELFNALSMNIKDT